jgi:succinate dehydrogenase flavin-adding protein (antitoxin of CptAB toxin-antitoxin module)
MPADPNSNFAKLIDHLTTLEDTAFNIVIRDDHLKSKFQQYGIKSLNLEQLKTLVELLNSEDQKYKIITLALQQNLITNFDISQLETLVESIGGDTKHKVKILIEALNKVLKPEEALNKVLKPEKALNKGLKPETAINLSSFGLSQNNDDENFRIITQAL